MFVRARKARGITYYQLVEGYRDKLTGKVRHRTVGLGQCDTVAEALKAERSVLRSAKARRGRWAGIPNSEVAERELKRWDGVVRWTERKIAKLEEAQRQGVR